MKIYKVYEQDYYGYDGDIKYFLKLDDAKLYLNELIKKARKNPDKVKKEDLDGKKNLIDVADKEEFIKGVIHKFVFYFWQQCSCEYNEYDIYCNNFIVQEIEVQ